MFGPSHEDLLFLLFLSKIHYDTYGLVPSLRSYLGRFSNISHPCGGLPAARRRRAPLHALGVARPRPVPAVAAVAAIALLHYLTNNVLMDRVLIKTRFPISLRRPFIFGLCFGLLPRYYNRLLVCQILVVDLLRVILYLPQTQ